MKANVSEKAQKRPRVAHIPTVVEAVSADIRKRVLDGEFEPGSQLLENDLLEDYGIARHGIRSALHSLAHEGLLRHVPHRGVFVPEASRDEVIQVLQARRVIEGGSIRRIITDDLDTSQIRKAAERLGELPPDAAWSELLAADLAVHKAIVDAQENLRLSRIADSLISESAFFLAFYGPKDQQRKIIRPNHNELVKKITSGECEDALRLLEEDLVQGLQAMSVA